MDETVKRLLIVVAPILVLVLGLLWGFLEFVAPIGTNYAAKIACSATFVSGREIESIRARDVADMRAVGVRLEVDPAEQVVRAHWMGGARALAVFRPGYGCTLVHDQTPTRLRAQALPPPRTPVPATPFIDAHSQVLTSSLGLDRRRLDRALRDAFEEPQPETAPRRTRAVVVLYRGHLVAEGYRQGFHATMPLIGWSMTKSVLATLYGFAQQRYGRPELDAAAPVAAWAEDDRRNITFRQLLQMSDGLGFEERYGPMSDATDMLYRSEDMGRFVVSKPLVAEPGTRFNYSSGTSNLLSRLLRRELGDARYHGLPGALFDRLGLASARLELDASGTFVGSSYAFMTARDWARLGQLYLQDGVWAGERVLPEGFVTFVRTSAPDAKGNYGGHFWLNQGSEEERWLPRVPEDAFVMRGYEGQFVVIIPSREAVIVRLGQTPPGGDWPLDRFLGMVLAGLPEAE